MRCTKCGTDNREGARFCTKCGNTLELGRDSAGGRGDSGKTAVESSKDSQVSPGQTSRAQDTHQGCGCLAAVLLLIMTIICIWSLVKTPLWGQGYPLDSFKGFARGFEFVVLGLMVIIGLGEVMGIVHYSSEEGRLHRYDAANRAFVSGSLFGLFVALSPLIPLLKDHLIFQPLFFTGLTADGRPEAYAMVGLALLFMFAVASSRSDS